MNIPSPQSTSKASLAYIVLVEEKSNGTAVASSVVASMVFTDPVVP